MWNAMGLVLQPPLKLGSAILPKPRPQPVSLPSEVLKQPSTPKPELDASLARLQAGSSAWVRVDVAERASLLKTCMDNMVRHAEDFARLGVAAKGSYGSGLGEEMTGLLPVVLGLSEYIQSMRANAQLPALATRTAPNGAPVIKVFPRGMLGALFPGCLGEVWCAPGKPVTQGAVYRKKEAGEGGKGGVALVLGAGNQPSVVILDFLHKLVAEDEVVIAKMSPVNDYCTPLLRRVFAPLVSRGFLDFACGGPDVGSYLVQAPQVSAIHLTGSHHTFNAIVWGSPTAERSGTPKVTKRITAELGNVTPYIIIPGPWSQDDIKFHAKSIVAGLAQNAGHNCLKAELLVMAADWPLRPALMEAIKAELNASPQRAAYYPGSPAKFEAFRKKYLHHKVLELGVPPPSTSTPPSCPASPWLLVEGLGPDEASTQEENWCGVLQEVVLAGSDSDPAAFMRAALAFANERAWGSLACSVWLHPRSRSAVGETAWQEFIGALHYGCVTVNAPATFGYAFTALPWGAAAGGSLQEVGSGIGLVHNTGLYDTAEKGVLYAPWRIVPKPIWHLDHRSSHLLVPPIMRLASCLATGNPDAMRHLLLTALQAMRG